MNQRKIIHVDMDAFYASIEQRDHPEYRGKPIAVGRPEMRGVVAAASYEARRFGVRSAMPSMKALKLCPHLIFTRNRMDVYKAVSAQIHAIFHRYTDLVEPLSLDEAFLDVTENKPGIPLAVDIARRIKKEIRRELHLTASAGVSYNKFLAKIASDYRKPDGLFTIHPSRAEKFIAAIYELNERLGIPRKIEGIEEEDIDVLAAYADREANPLYPVPILWDREELKEIYRKARG